MEHKYKDNKRARKQTNIHTVRETDKHQAKKQTDKHVEDIDDIYITTDRQNA